MIFPTGAGYEQEKKEQQYHSGGDPEEPAREDADENRDCLLSLPCVWDDKRFLGDRGFWGIFLNSVIRIRVECLDGDK